MNVGGNGGNENVEFAGRADRQRSRIARPRSAWSEERIRDELRPFLAGRGEWPSYREFQRAGLKALRDSITGRGGARRWAREMGVQYVERRPGYAPIWTEERIRSDLAAYLARRHEWPSRDEFEHDGKTALRNAINRTGGPDRWAQEFGLQRKDRLSGVRRGWTRELIESELRNLIGDGKTWPTQREFDDAGLDSLRTAIYRHEGSRFWAKRMGVRWRSSLGRPGPKAWTEARIRTELQAFCTGRDVWPTEREFAAAGKRKLYNAASRNGGVRRWAAELGVARRADR